MRYGLTYKIEVYNFTTETESVIYSRPSDYLQMEKFLDSGKIRDMGEAVVSVYSNYATLFYAIKREGKLADYQIESDVLDIPTIDAMTENLSIFLSSAKDGDFPLARMQKK